MVIIFSKKKNRAVFEITEILKKYGANIISDSFISSGKSDINIIIKSKTADIEDKKGIVLIADSESFFQKQNLPENIIGICDSGSKAALEIFEKNQSFTVTCGLNPKSTVTFSSYNNNQMLITLQRTIYSIYGQNIEPAEFKIKLDKNFLPFSVMASAVILLILGITPEKF